MVRKTRAWHRAITRDCILLIPGDIGDWGEFGDHSRATSDFHYRLVFLSPLPDTIATAVIGRPVREVVEIPRCTGVAVPDSHRALKLIADWPIQSWHTQMDHTVVVVGAHSFAPGAKIP